MNGQRLLGVSKAELEAYTTLEIKTDQCLVLKEEEGAIRQRETFCGFMTQGLLVTSRMILDHTGIF